VLIKPDMTVSTKEIYEGLALTRGMSRIKLSPFMARPWVLKPVLENDLEAVTVSRYPELDSIKVWLLEQGALGALMSGSGPTVSGFSLPCSPQRWSGSRPGKSGAAVGLP